MPPNPAGSGDSKNRLNRTGLGLEKISNIQGKKRQGIFRPAFFNFPNDTL
jgi:hypothetical protein